jgi:hypothetical protein
METGIKRRETLATLCWGAGWLLLTICFVWVTFLPSLVPSNWIVRLALIITLYIFLCLTAIEKFGIVDLLPPLRSFRFPVLIILLVNTMTWSGLCVLLGFWMLGCLFCSGSAFLGSELLKTDRLANKANIEAK